MRQGILHFQTHLKLELKVNLLCAIQLYMYMHMYMNEAMGPSALIRATCMSMDLDDVIT